MEGRGEGEDYEGGLGCTHGSRQEGDYPRLVTAFGTRTTERLPTMRRRRRVHPSEVGEHNRFISSMAQIQGTRPVLGA